MWCSNQQPLHCAFSLERYSPATAQLSCKISVRQVKGHEQILQVYTAVSEVRLCSWGGGVDAQPLCNLPGVCPLTAQPSPERASVLTERGGHLGILHSTQTPACAPANSLHRRHMHPHLGAAQCNRSLPSAAERLRWSSSEFEILAQEHLDSRC